MPQTQDQLATAEDVLDFASNIPKSLTRCREDRHHFDLKVQAVPLNALGERTTTRARLNQIEYVDICPACGLRRHHLYVLHSGARSDYWYTNRNPDLIAPRGVYNTGVSVRAEIQRNSDRRAAAAVLTQLGEKPPSKGRKAKAA